jgi:peptidoglycan/xylan/chitin deacetylase (PgdA/CDA1 family)
VVWPLLQREGVPATIFVCPGLAEVQGNIWNLELRLRWNRLPAPQRQALASRIGLNSIDAETLVSHAKGLGLAARRRLEALVQTATADWQPNELDRPLIRAMGWASLRSMDPALIDFGCQSMTHPILTHLDEAEAQVEIVDSRRLLEERLQRPVDTFVYPNGDADAVVLDRVAAHYRAGFSSSPGFADAAKSRHFIDRIPAAEDMARFLWRMHRPGW